MTFVNLIVKNVLDNSLEYSKKEKLGNGRVRLSKALLIIGIIDVLAFLIPIIVLVLKGDVFPEIIIMLSFFCLPGVVMILGFCNCRLQYNDDYFIHKNIIGIKRKYLYSDVTGIRKSEHETFVFVGKKRVLVDEFAVGGKDFIKFINQKYQQLYRKNVPAEPFSKKDIFKGNLKAPEDIKAAFIICYVIMAVLFVFLIAVFSSENEKTITVNEAMISCDTNKIIGGRNVEMFSAEGVRYLIRNIPDDFDVEKINSICNGKSQMTLEVVKSNTKDNEIYYSVSALSVNNEKILSQSETAKFEKDMYYELVFFITGMFFLLVTFFLAVIIFAARNAEKYPKFALMVFKKSQLTIYDRKQHHKNK